MRFSVLALDYDGTIAHEGALDPEVRQAIREVRAHGMTVCRDGTMAAPGGR